MKLIYLMLMMKFILTGCGFSSSTALMDNLADDSGCSAILDSVTCQNSTPNTVGCTWITTPGVAGRGVGCQAIQSCAEATTTYACYNAAGTCIWDKDKSMCNDNTQAIPQKTGCYNPDNPVSQTDCAYSYQPSLSEKSPAESCTDLPCPTNCDTPPCPAAPCVWIVYRGGYCLPANTVYSSNIDLCTFTDLPNVCNGIGTCTWARTSCIVNAPLFCTKFGDNCCPLGVTTCKETDLNCIANVDGTCNDRADAVCTPNSIDNTTVCCSGTDHTCKKTSPSCSLAPPSCFKKLY